MSDRSWTTVLRRGEQAGEQLLETLPLPERSGVCLRPATRHCEFCELSVADGISVIHRLGPVS